MLSEIIVPVATEIKEVSIRDGTFEVVRCEDEVQSGQ